MRKLPDFVTLKPYLLLLAFIIIFILLFIAFSKIEKAQQSKAKRETENMNRRFYFVRSKKVRRFSASLLGYLFIILGLASPAAAFAFYPDVIKILFGAEAAFIIIGIILIKISKCCIEVRNDRAFVCPIIGSPKEFSLSELCSFTKIPAGSTESLAINPGGMKQIIIDSTMPGYDYLKSDLIALNAGRKLKACDKVPDNYSKEFKYNKENKHTGFKIFFFALITIALWVAAYNINTNRFVNLNGEYLSIKETTKLTAQQLYKDGKPCADPNVLKKLYNVDTVDISNSDVTDISILTSLPNLKSVCAVNNSITDITPLLKIEHLSTLNIQYNCINDISSLSEFNGLNGLELCGNPIEDFSPLFEVDTLKYLDLRDTAITQDEYYNLKVSFLGCMILVDF